MIDVCRDAGVKLMEAFMYRLHPMWVEAKRMVDSGAIGDLLAIQSFFSYRNVDPSNIRNIARFGGGALMDVGCYPVNVARLFFGAEPDTVKSSILRDPAFGTDAVTSAVLDFGGRHATFTCSTQLEDEQSVLLVGTTGRLEIEIPFNIPPDRPDPDVSLRRRRSTGLPARRSARVRTRSTSTGFRQTPFPAPSARTHRCRPILMMRSPTSW